MSSRSSRDGAERLLLGRELLLLQGYPVSNLCQHVQALKSKEVSSERFFSDLSASSLSLTVVLAVFVATWRAVFWRDLEENALGAVENPEKAFEFEPATQEEDAFVNKLLASMV